MQLVELQKIAGELASRDVAPFAISYDSVETLGAFAERNAIGYPLLADEGSNAIRGLGMLDEDLDQHHAEMGGAVRDDQRGVCYPGVFLLDERGIVVQRRFQRNYRVRESGLGLLEQALNVSLPGAGPSASVDRERVRISVHLDSPTYWRYQQLRAVVELDIASGYHVYAPGSPDDYVSLGVEVSADAVEVGELLWPAARPFSIEGLDEQLQVFEGSVRVAVPFELIIQRGEPMGDRAVTVMVRYQTCDAGNCYLPEEVSVQLMVEERPSVE